MTTPPRDGQTGRFVRARPPDPTPGRGDAAAVLAARALALARIPERPPDAAETVEVVTFRLADERYALETRFVRRVERLGETTPVPGTPDHLLGVVNSHGEILAVFDLRPLLGVERRAPTEQTRLLVVADPDGPDGDEFAVVADAAHEVVILRRADLFAPPGQSEGPGGFPTRGTTRDALVVLDGAGLLRDDRLTIKQGDEPGL